MERLDVGGGGGGEEVVGREGEAGGGGVLKLQKDTDTGEISGEAAEENRSGRSKNPGAGLLHLLSLVLLYTWPASQGEVIIQLRRYSAALSS